MIGVKGGRATTKVGLLELEDDVFDADLVVEQDATDFEVQRDVIGCLSDQALQLSLLHEMGKLRAGGDRDRCCGIGMCHNPVGLL